MTVHVNPITQAAPSQRRIISISEASNQLLFPYQKFFVEWICWRINIFLKSCSRSKKLQPGGKPNSFAFRNLGRPRRSINCSWDGSRTASRFAIQVNRDGWSNCSQLGSRPSPANKPCLSRGDSSRSSGQTRRRSASDGCCKGRWETWSCWQCGCFHPQLSWYSSIALIVSVGILGWWDAAHRFLPVYIINFTTGLRAYIHTFMTIFPNAVSHSLLSIIFNTACLHVTWIWFLPAYLLHVLVRFLRTEICCVLWLRKFCYYEPVVAIVGDHPYFEVFVGGKVCQRTQPLSCSRHKKWVQGTGTGSSANHDVWAWWLLARGRDMGREWGKRRREFSCRLFCCPMLAGNSSRTGFGMVGYTFIEG